MPLALFLQCSDPVYRRPWVVSRPVNKLDIVRYMYAQKLDCAPGTATQYSNYGYLLLSAVVEQVAGMDFFTYVQQTLLQPAGITFS